VLRRKGAAVFVGLCIVATILFLFDVFSISMNERTLLSSSSDLHRYLKEKVYPAYSWAIDFMKPANAPPLPEEETVLFWHIPKSGGTTAVAIYACLGQTIVNQVGTIPKFGHDQDKELTTFQPWKKWGVNTTYVNVDTNTEPGILRAKEMGLVPSGIADVIFTTEPHFAIENLYDSSHRGRAMALFRHPVDRLVSKFFYLQVADWEVTYAPHWKRLSVLQWAEINRENNFMVMKLAGKTPRDEVTEVDLRVAMETIKRRFIVGLLDHMEESIHRFNIVLGIDGSKEENKQCMDQFFGDDVVKRNSNAHRKIKRGSPGWRAIAEKNSLDMRLYDFILEVYEEQREFLEPHSKMTTALGQS